MWLDTDLDQLRTAINSGLSASQASKFFDGKFSRNACLSKAHYLGLHFISRPPNAPSDKPSPRPSPDSPPQLQIVVSNDTPHARLCAEQAIRDAANPGWPYMQLAFGDQACRWPLNDHSNIENHRVCGKHAEDSRWCEEHRAVVYKKQVPREPRHIGKKRQ